MDSRHKFSALPDRTRIIGKVQEIVGAGTEMRHLLPEPSSEQGKANQRILYVRSIRKLMPRVRHQDFIIIHGIDAADRLDQLSGIATESDVGIFEMPGGDDDFH